MTNGIDSIRIDTGVKRVLINDGPVYIEFNPSDILFAERYYQLLKTFETKLLEYKARARVLDANTSTDVDGLPANIPEGFGMVKEASAFMRVEVDKLFGEGTSQKVFGDAVNLDMFDQFFNGLAPFISRAREEKVSKYLDKPKRKKVR
jgi:hypothetical protein